MKTQHCEICGHQTAHKRRIGVGTLLLVIFTSGLWILVIPFYQVRCVVCGTPIGNINNFK